MKHGKELLTIGVGLVLGLVAIPVLAADRVPVTDPATLASMGFSPDARNVYMMTNVARGDEAADFGIGTSHPHYTGVQGATFQCRRNIAGSCQYIADGFTFQPQGTEIFATAEFQLPQGANLSGFRWWASDTNAAQDLTIFFESVCLPTFSAGTPVNTIIGQDSTTGSGGVCCWAHC